MKIITREVFEEVVRNGGRGHWKHWEDRWKYFDRIGQLVLSLGIENPKLVLEMGTKGASVVEGSDTLDYDKHWNFKGQNPTYLHDARYFPWPVEDKKYTLFIASRVFQHLSPVQKECFLESRRVSLNTIIVVPKEYKTGTGISLEMFSEWNGGESPDICERIFNDTFLYMWKEKK